MDLQTKRTNGAVLVAIARIVAPTPTSEKI
jgi:hypothetical protein